MLSMEPDTLWSALLTAAIGLVGWALKAFADEQKRQQILLNKTREELARRNVGQGNYGSAALNSGFALLDMVPGLGKAAKAMKGVR